MSKKPVILQKNFVPVNDDSPMPFGKYGPQQGDPRKLRDVPRAYLLHLVTLDVMYFHPALEEYIIKLFPKLGDTPAPTPSKSKPAPTVWKDDPTLREFLKTLGGYPLTTSNQKKYEN